MRADASSAAAPSASVFANATASSIRSTSSPPTSSFSRLRNSARRIPPGAHSASTSAAGSPPSCRTSFGSGRLRFARGDAVNGVSGPESFPASAAVASAGVPGRRRRRRRLDFDLDRFRFSATASSATRARRRVSAKVRAHARSRDPPRRFRHTAHRDTRPRPVLPLLRRFVLVRRGPAKARSTSEARRRRSESPSPLGRRRRSRRASAGTPARVRSSRARPGRPRRSQRTARRMAAGSAPGRRARRAWLAPTFHPG